MMNPNTDPDKRRRALAVRIRQAIQASDMTQRDIAARMEISEQYLCDILNARRGVSAFVAVRLQVILGVDAHKLLIDQTLAELEVARAEYRPRVTA